jgi:mRNA interferase HigB
MTVIGTDKLEVFIKRHAQARKPLQAWLAEVRKSVWKTPKDIKIRYRSSDFLAGNRVIFDIKGNSYRLVVKVRYEGSLVLVEWVGTPAEYDRKTF